MTNSKEQLVKILKEKYDYENERKRYFDNVITLPVTLLAFIVAGMYVIIIDKESPKWFTDFIHIVIYPILLSTVISMFFLFRVYFGLKRKYNTFPSSKVVMDDYKKIEDYYKSINETKNVEKKISDDFDDFIISWYKTINENNIVVNDRRMDNFHYSKFSIGVSYLLAILVFTLYCNSKINFINMAKNPTVQTPPPPPPKPTPSPIRREKADKIPIKTK